MKAALELVAKLLGPRLVKLLQPGKFGRVHLELVIQNGQIVSVSEGESEVTKVG